MTYKKNGQKVQVLDWTGETDFTLSLGEVQEGVPRVRPLPPMPQDLLWQRWRHGQRGPSRHGFRPWWCYHADKEGKIEGEVFHLTLLLVRHCQRFCSQFKNYLFSAPTPQILTSFCLTGGDPRHWATSPWSRATGPCPPLPRPLPLAGDPSSTHLSPCHRSVPRRRRQLSRERRACQTAKELSRTPLCKVLGFNLQLESYLLSAWKILKWMYTPFIRQLSHYMSCSFPIRIM